MDKDSQKNRQDGAAEGSPTWRRLCGVRFPVVLLLLTVWSFMLLFRLFYIMVIERDEHMVEMRQDAVVQHMKPPKRGRILNSAGDVLAWSTRYYQLVWEIPNEEIELRRVKKILGLQKITIAISETEPGERIVVIPKVTGAKMADLLPVLEKHPSLRLKSVFERHYKKGWHGRLGRVEMRDGIQRGVSGVEKDFDNILTGEPEIYRVHVNDLGQPVPGSLEIVKYEVSGRDVTLPGDFKGGGRQ